MEPKLCQKTHERIWETGLRQLVTFVYIIYFYNTEPLWFKLKDNSDKCDKIETCSLVDPVGADRTRTHLLHTADPSRGLQQQILGKEKNIPKITYCKTREWSEHENSGSTTDLFI